MIAALLLLAVMLPVAGCALEETRPWQWNAGDDLAGFIRDLNVCVRGATYTTAGRRFRRFGSIRTATSRPWSRRATFGSVSRGRTGPVIDARA